MLNTQHFICEQHANFMQLENFRAQANARDGARGNSILPQEFVEQVPRIFGKRTTRSWVNTHWEFSLIWLFVKMVHKEA